MDIIEQMKSAQSRVGSVIDKSNYKDSSKGEIVGGEGIEVKTDGNKVSISQSQQEQQSQQSQQPSIVLPSGTGVLGINNGVLFIYETTECA